MSVKIVGDNIIIEPGNKPGHVIDQMFAIISTDDEGEGLLSFLPPGDKVHIPMIAADRARLDSLIGAATFLAKATGGTYTVIRLSERTVLGAVDKDGFHEAKP